MPKEKNNHITLEGLAIVINKEFTEMRKHTDQRMEKIASVQKDMHEAMHAMHEDIRYTRSTMSKFVHNDIAQDATLENLTARVHRLEQKAGFAK